MNLKELLEKHGLKLNKKDMETAQNIADELTKPLHGEIFGLKILQMSLDTEIGTKDKEIERLEHDISVYASRYNTMFKKIEILERQLTATNTVMGYLRKLISKFSWGRKDAQ